MKTNWKAPRWQSPSLQWLAAGFLSLPLLAACGARDELVPPFSQGALQRSPSGSTLGSHAAFNHNHPPGRSYRYVKIPKSWGAQLSKKQFIVDHNQDSEYVYGYLFDSHGPSPFKVLADLPPDSEVLDESLVQTRGIKGILERGDPSVDQGDLAAGYHNYTQLTSFLVESQKAAADLVSLTSIGQSVQGREIWMVKISDHVQQDEREPKVLLVANMHGDEVVGRELMINLVEHLLGQYQKDLAITDLINHSQIYIIPSMNPDGFELKQRFNADGVDLNRDFPDFTSDPNNTPTGRAPETQSVMNLFKEHHFVVSFNFHGGEVCFNLPWDTQENGTPRLKFGDDPLVNQWGRSYADLSPTMKANSGGSFDRGLTYGYEWYEVDGGLQDWAIHYQNSIHSTIELSYAKWPPARQLPAFWNENREPILRLIGRAREGIHINLTGSSQEDPQTAHPPEVSQATITVAGLNRPLTYQTPVIHRNALSSSPPTLQVEVTIKAPGYKPLTTLVPWKVFKGQFDAVTLVPINQP